MKKKTDIEVKLPLFILVQNFIVTAHTLTTQQWVVEFDLYFS